MGPQIGDLERSECHGEPKHRQKEAQIGPFWTGILGHPTGKPTTLDRGYKGFPSRVSPKVLIFGGVGRAVSATLFEKGEEYLL